MPELKVRIVTVGELAGAKAVEAQLERQIGQAKALDKEYKHLEDQLGAVRAKMDDYTKSQAAGNQASASLGGAVGKLWGGFRALTYILPGLGMAGAIGLIWEAFSALIGKSGETAASLEALEKKAKAIQEAMARSKADVDAYAVKLSLIGTEAKTAAEWLARVQEEITKTLTDDQQILEREKAVELAKAGSMRDPIARREKEFEIEKAFAERKTALERKAIEDRMKKEGDAYAKAAIDREKYGARARATEQDLGMLKAQQAGRGGQLAAEQKTLAELEKKRQLEQEYFARWENRNVPESARQRMRDDLAQAKAKEDEQRKIVTMLQADLEASARQIETASELLKEYRRMETESKTFTTRADATKGERWGDYNRQRTQLDRRHSLDTEAAGQRAANDLSELREREAERERRERERKDRDTESTAGKVFGELQKDSRVNTVNYQVRNEVSLLVKAILDDRMKDAEQFRSLRRELDMMKSRIKFSMTYGE